LALRPLATTPVHALLRRGFSGRGCQPGGLPGGRRGVALLLAGAVLTAWFVLTVYIMWLAPVLQAERYARQLLEDDLRVRRHVPMHGPGRSSHHRRKKLTRYFGIGIDSPPGEGWVRLAVEKPKRRGLAGVFRGRDSEFTAWADATAHELVGADDSSGTHSGPDVLARYTDLLTDLTVSARERDVLRSYAWVPRSMKGALVARIDISTIRWPTQGPELTLDALEEMHAKRDESAIEL
jgi:hypothetical protein